ncbi:tetratricopeptide repeat protein [Polaribacter sp.]|uniref:tetratricopeptide repeat protein n=2 Tax=Polaribacter sp. TaxID=1920175 RepID=UPI004047D5B9
MKKKIVFILLFVIVKVGAQTPTFSAIDSLIENGRYLIALQKLDRLKPTYQSNFKTALIYESIENYQKTADFLEKALDFQQDDKTKLKLAKTYQILQKSDKAIPIYEELVAKDSLNLILKFQLGKLYLVAKKSENAKTTFQYLIKKEPTNSHFSYQLALAFAQQNDRDRMINSFIDTYKKDTLHFKAIENLAYSFGKLGDVDSTMLFVEKGLVLDKNHINLNKIKINQLYKETQYEKAIPLLLHLDTIDKNETFSKNMLGKVYYYLDSLEKAKMYFKKLSILDKEEFKSYTYLGHIAFKEKKFNDARMYYMMATVVGKRKRDEEYYGLGSVFFETKNPKEAINAFEKAYQENTRNYRALYQFAKLSDDYYKEKKTAYKLYVKYIETFYDTDIMISEYVKRRIQDIKKDYFLKGETLD